MRVLRIVLIVMRKEKKRKKENSLKERRANPEQLIGLRDQAYH